jgi:hypothetical protein
MSEPAAVVRRISIPIFVGYLTCLIAPASGRTWPGSWCEMPATEHHWNAPVGRERDDIHVFYIRRSELAGALRRLRQQSVIRIGRREFRRLVQSGEPTGQYLYLARAGVQTRLDMPENEFLDVAESAGYEIDDRGFPDGFKIGSLMMSGYVANYRTYAVLLASPERIPSLRVICLGGT